MKPNGHMNKFIGTFLLIVAPILATYLLLTDNDWLTAVTICVFFLIPGFFLILERRISKLIISKDVFEIETLKEKAQNDLNEITELTKQIKDIETELINIKKRSIQTSYEIKKLQPTIKPKVNKGFQLNENWFARAILYNAPHSFLQTGIQVRIIFTNNVFFVRNVSWGINAYDDPENATKEWFTSYEKNNSHYDLKKSNIWEFALPSDTREWRLFIFLSNFEIEPPSIEILDFETIFQR